MGTCFTKPQRQRDVSIQKQLLLERNEDRCVKKILLFGLSNCGKSTIMKQLRIIHGDSYSYRDRLIFIDIIHKQCLSQMNIMIQYLLNHNDNPYNKMSKQLLDAIQNINDIKTENIKLNNSIVSSIKYLWNTPAIQRIFEMRNESPNLNLYECTEYFLNDIDRINENQYIPTDKDIVFVNQRHTKSESIQELRFRIHSHNFLMINIDQNVESLNKWFHCFDMIASLIFVASLPCYDSACFYSLHLLVFGYINNMSFDMDIPYDLIELISNFCPSELISNTMSDQLELFDNVLNDIFLRRTSMVLFLNKKDEFHRKIQSIPITVCSSLKDYDGDTQSYADSLDFIRYTFESLNRNPRERQIYTHTTCGTDRDNLEKTFNDVRMIWVSQSLCAGFPNLL